LPSLFSICIDQLRMVLKMLCAYALPCLHPVNVDRVRAWSMHRYQDSVSAMNLNVFFVSFLGYQEKPLSDSGAAVEEGDDMDSGTSFGARSVEISVNTIVEIMIFEQEYLTLHRQPERLMWMPTPTSPARLSQVDLQISLPWTSCNFYADCLVIHNPMGVLTGPLQCLCGHVQITFRTPPAFTFVCHCRLCRRSRQVSTIHIQDS